MKFKRLNFLSILIMLHLQVFAQESSKKVSISSTQTNLTEILLTLESQTNNFFYFDKEGTDTTRITDKRIDNEHLSTALEKLLANTGYNYLIRPSGDVIITYNISIQKELPIGFYDIDNSGEQELSLEAINFIEVKQEDKIKQGIEDQLLHIGNRTSRNLSGNSTIAGHVVDVNTGEAIVGAVIYIKEPNIGVASDQFGYFSFSIPKGRQELHFQSVGMKPTKRQIILYSDGTLDVKLQEDVITLKEILIESERDIHVGGLQMGLEKIDMAIINQVPTILGERDVMKIALTLPGVQTVGEGSSGFNVRGGSADQNLITINEGVVYNSAHFFGFFSIFNPDVIKSVDLYKSGIPAQYGGRISSIFDVKTRDGNKNKFSVMGGISPVTARLTFEGPIVKDKTSFIIGLRTTYSDWLLDQIPDEQIRGSSAEFQDASAKISHIFGKKDEISVSGYFSKDKFKLYSDSTYSYSNVSGTLQWKHIFNNKLYGVLTSVYSDYNYSVILNRLPKDAFDQNYRLQSANAKLDFSYFPSSQNKVDFGVSTILYGLEPGNKLPIGDSSLISPFRLEQEQGLESAVYLGDQIEISDRLSLYAGLRYSFFQYLGPKNVHTYPTGQPRVESNILDTIAYQDKEVIVNYHGPEYRASLRYILNHRSSIKLSFNRLRQYIHMMSNSAAISPTDTWKLSDPHIRPQIGDQLALGYYRNLRQNSIEFSIETYYKNIIDIVDYKDGAKLLLNDKLETDIINGVGKAYGVEVLLKKKLGKFNGWLSYTYSRTFVKIDSDYEEESVNRGEWFPANYDKPHSLNIIANYKINRRFNISSNFVYSTGRPITIPVAYYMLDGAERVLYSDRNQYRLPAYVRLDLSVQLEGNHKVDKSVHGSWSFSIYNVLGRDNVYSIFFVKYGNEVKGYQLSVFANPIPTITYNFKF